MDLAGQFTETYKDLFKSSVWSRAGRALKYTGIDALRVAPGSLRSIYQSYFAPGILYNSIKSGIAVDYPILFDRYKMMVGSHYTNYAYKSFRGSESVDGPHVAPYNDYSIHQRFDGAQITA